MSVDPRIPEAFRLVQVEGEVTRRTRYGGDQHRPGLTFPTTVTMADPWLAHKVMREMDLAGAQYFALTLRTPTGRSCLVC